MSARAGWKILLNNAQRPGMTASKASITRLPNRNNIVMPHAPVNGKITTIDIEWSETANAAGGIVSNITDLSKWLIMQMDNGKYGVENVQKVLGTLCGRALIHLHGLVCVRYKQLRACRYCNTITLIQLKLGIIVLTNQQSGAAFTATP
ncbi:MAG: hypothetical protein IPI88_10035 [Chitinophagaceae bacterium]|nr:hypothetical protein [Chitinophagaceae bacterium]